LSVVMIYERPNDLDNLDFKKERRVAGALQTFTTGSGVTGGATGGEIRLAAPSAEALKVKPNEWVMVSGSYNTVTRFQWYRISDSDPEPVLNPVTGLYEL